MSSPGGSFLEGLMGGFEGGHGFRTANNQRKRANTIEDETLALRRAQELRANVGFQLQQKVAQGHLLQQDREGRGWDIEQRRAGEADAATADRRGRVKKAADAIRANPKFTTDEHIAPLLDLPDEELVKGLMDLVSNPQRSDRPDGYGTLTPGQRMTADRENLHSVERQVDDTRADLGRAEREAPKRPMFFIDQAGEQSFRADSTASADLIGKLRQRSDSLGGVRDSVAARIQGRSGVRPAAGARPPASGAPPMLRRPAGRGAPDDVLQQVGKQFNWDEAKIRQELTRLGYDPDA